MPIDIPDDVKGPASLEERRHWIYAIAVAVTSGIYCAVIASRAAEAPISEVAYIKPMLWAIGLTIAATIVLTIAAAIGSEVKAAVGIELAARAEGSTAQHRSGGSGVGKTDRRDKEIDRFGEWAGHWLVVAGSCVALVLAMVEAEPFWIANTIYLAFVLNSICSSIVKIVVYRRGFWT